MLPVRNPFARRRPAQPPAQPHATIAPPTFSHYSTPAVPNSLWFASDFLLGAGMVVIQPSTQRIVLIHDGSTGLWILPKGRKDIGESLEQAALREAYEETGYRSQFLPLLSGSRAPAPGSLRNAEATTEPIYVSTIRFGREYGGHGGEYLTFWYVGYIDEDAVREENTGMIDEKQYVSHLLTPQQALERLGDATIEAQILQMAWHLFGLTYLSSTEDGQADQEPSPPKATASASSQGHRNRRQGA
ncbi:hypothetical protein OE88DRAFT_557685 [Heliocybe sulcata]|uniref:Nudix hydrolase domain-containing protein n=1 Tax=Heliocybe sulcata TaxID=5364 RepID=A0A5C3MTQ3_9AGAM|nr:hypothetical protein OE88DRAFT_557685 [Heliocybe sulcata]